MRVHKISAEVGKAECGLIVYEWRRKRMHVLFNAVDLWEHTTCYRCLSKMHKQHALKPKLEE